MSRFYLPLIPFILAFVFISFMGQTQLKSSTSLEIPQLTEAVQIDGLMDLEWHWTEPLPLENALIVWGMLDPSDYIPNATDFSANARVLWDETYFYLFVEVTDDLPQAPYTGTWFQEDTVEIYLDADRLNAPANGTYDGINDWEIGIHSLADPIDIVFGPNSVNSSANFVVAIQMTEEGYDLEIAMPWETLGLPVSPLTDHLIGLDIHAIDNDNDVGQRESKITWFGTEDEAWRDTTVLADAILKAKSPFAVFTQFPQPLNLPLSISSEGAWSHGLRSPNDWFWVSPQSFPWAFHSELKWIYLVFESDTSWWAWVPAHAEGPQWIHLID